MSASNSYSSSNPSNTNSQVTSQGAAGANSPTITGVGGNVDVNDPQLQLATVQSLASIVADALSGAGAISDQTLQILANNSATTAQQGAAQSGANNDLLQQVLASENALATAQGTGGASLTSATNNYVVWGLIGVAGLFVLGLIFNRK